MKGQWTLLGIASAIKNNLEAGLKGTANYSFSMEQLEYEVISTRNAIIKQLDTQGILDKTEFVQEINCIPVDCEKLSLCCDVNTKTTTLHFELPIFTHIEYVGTPNRDKPFKIYNNSNFIYNKFRNSKLNKRPYVSMRINEGIQHGFLFNPPTSNIKYVSVSGILSNPLDVNKYSCCNYNPREDKFPAPDYVITQIIDTMTSKWSSWYYRFNNSKSNNQTGLP